MQNEDDPLFPRDDGSAEFVELKGMFQESIRQVGKFIRCTHADEVRSEATMSVGAMGNYVPPQVRRSWIAVEEEENGLLLMTFCWCSIYVGRFGIVYFDALKRKREVG